MYETEAPMDKMWTFYSSVILLSVIQIQHVFSTGCKILSVTSPSASTLDVQWTAYPSATNYLLDLRIVNSTNTAAVLVTAPASSTQRLVQGLSPGLHYHVKQKVMEYYEVVCEDTVTALTVPGTPQITLYRAVSSTSLKVEWTSMEGADSYTLFVDEYNVYPIVGLNRTFSGTTGIVDGLMPSKSYNCYVTASNTAGSGASSISRTVTTLQQPPTGVVLVSTSRSTANLTWDPVNKVLLYQVRVTDIDNPGNAPILRNTSTTSMTITNLEPCSTYTVGVSSINVFLDPGDPSDVNYTTSTINPVTTVVVQNYNCAAKTITVTWDLVFGANSYEATAVDHNGASLNCSSSSTSCQIQNLPCGRTYQVHVTAHSDDCSNTSTASATFETVPCAPTNLLTEHNCSSNVIVFSWGATNRTRYYVATATDNTGAVTECRTADFRCYFTNIACGQVYTYNVYAISFECNSEVSESKTVQTSPCLPSNIRTSHQCLPNQLITTWDYSTGAQTYTVRAEGNRGLSYNCSSSNNSCAVTGIPCGEHLSVWVTASNDNCTTNRVLGEVAQTVPCSPINVSASVDCSHASARMNWTTSNGAVFYLAVARDVNGSEHSCTSVGSTCLIEGLQCGQSYNASVISTNLLCNTTSDQVSFMTAPCPPTAVQAVRDCSANHAVITWQSLQPTGNYTAILVDQSGAQLSCSSNTVHNCTVASLPCGKTYNVTVSYENAGHCPSVSAPIRMDSVPCGPQDVTASVTCVTGELTVAWNMSAPAENYTAVITRGPQTLHCNSTQMQCTAQGLQCGSSYAVKVFSTTGSCDSLPSSEITVQTLPCPPTNVAATSTCSPNLVPVSWVSSASATRYTVVALSSGGHRSECSSNTTGCSLPALLCGERYTIGVSGIDATCTGEQSSTVTLDTEPCPPLNVSSQLMCSAATAKVFWAPSANAVSYEVRAVGNQQNLNCTSSSNNCTLSNLVCGPAYQISVTATDGKCTSNYSAVFTQDPVPCAPQNINTNLQCGTNDLTVNWTLSAGPLNYSVSVVPLSGNMTALSCNTEGGNCSLMALQCGTTFNVSVKASSGSCCGPWSPVQTVQTAPCPPQGLTAVVPCGTNSLLASWTTSPDATSYVAAVTGPGSFSDSCTSSTGNCSVSGLQCASQYSVSLTAVDGQCSSAPTLGVVTTGPCPPINVTSNFHCATNMATVSWEAAAGAMGYTAIATDGSAQISCQTSSTSCQLNQLMCGTTYTLTVMAEDIMCNSTAAPGGSLVTAPCSPSIQSSALVCGTNTSRLTWAPMADATGYTVNATTAGGHHVLCSSANNSCVLSGLQCSETYTAAVVAQGSGCDSAPGPSMGFTTAPCPPTFTLQDYDCATSAATFNWTAPAGSVSYQAQLTGNGHQDSCPTSNTSCVFHNLPCDLDFNVTIQAQGTNCTSAPTVSQSIRTVPCAPQNVSGSLVCLNHSALVTWAGNPFAVGYNVSVTGQDGHTHHCHTNTTTCPVPNIHCGETYSIAVTPRSNSCPGNQSSPFSFSAGLCAPANVTADPSCENNTVSWSPVAGADTFIATATSDDGHNHTCSSNMSNSCNFTDLHCGEAYSVTVVTVDRGCSSDPSAAAMLRTALCPSSNLTSHVNCVNNTVTLTWDPSPDAGVTYKLQSEKLGSGLSPTEVTTPNTSHVFSNLPCGQRYAFRIKAQDAHCQSSYSPATEISTGPCQPTNFTARVDCGTNRANFSWGQSTGAEHYTVTVTGEHGHEASCSSNDTSCSVKLHCGRSYSAALVASTQNCNNSQHADIHFDSAPCLPDNVVAEVDCSTNVMNVTWAQTSGSDTYTAWAISGNGHNASCNSTSNSCLIQNLQCGKVYEVAVTTSTVHCSFEAGTDYKVQSVPCKPENTTVHQNCSSSAMTVQWAQSGTSQNYTVTATSATGANATCDTDQNSCPFLNLTCGQAYTFTVTGHTNVCMSESSSVNKTSAPCPPTGLTAALNCTTRDAVVSWSSAPASTGYTVQANSSNGHVSSCTDTGTSCRLGGLVCGQQYSVVVEANNTGCAGPASASAMLSTEPCAPTNLSVFYNVSTNSVRWSAAGGATSYSVEAVTQQGAMLTCNSSSTSCSLTGLQCGQIYNVTVTAHNQACDSLASETQQLTTEPCPPTNVQTNMACEQLSATVSWVGSLLAVSYVVYLDNQSGPSTSCFNASTQCTVSGLSCGTVYNVRVKALGAEHNSSDSTAVPATSGPCKPSGIAAVMDCQIRSASVSWQPGVGALSYTAQLTASSGATAACATNLTNCQPSPLQCGEEYNVSVTAHGAGCNSTAQMSGQLVTEPCVPTNLSVHYNVSTNSVSWSAAGGATSYSVKAVTQQGSTVSCNTSSTSCSLSGGLQCGQIYNVTVAAHNQACNNTVTSDPYQLQTEPCPPNNVQVSVACAQLAATASWEQSNLAVGYVAYFDNNNGHTASCFNTSTHCDVSGLSCGTVYSVRVKALGPQLNSSHSNMVSAVSAPCLPADVEVRVNCNSDGAALVSWNSTGGPANFSLTTTTGGSLQTLCTTQQNSCNVTNLTCGGKYNLSLTATNAQCSVSAPMSTNLTTRPCPPQRVAVALQCGSATADLSWETDPDVDLYVASAVKVSGGAVTTCNSTNSTCEFPALACGETYNFTVMAHTQSCCSQASDTVSVQTEPCQPVITSANPTSCQSDQVQISWNQASGVVNYLLTATGSLGFTDSFNTTQTSLSATLPCGQDYNLTIQGEGSQCWSNASGPAFVKTPPCVPRALMTYTQCQSNMGSVSWGPSDGAESYVAVATGLDGHAHPCASNVTTCTWNDLHCGEQYTVVVRAKQGNCSSSPSNSSVIVMAPCAPQTLNASVDCSLETVSLSWDGSNGTVYTVLVEGGGNSTLLTSNSNSSHFSNLTCGQHYNFSVTPQSQQCPSNSSVTASVQTWPCRPSGLSATVACLSGDATVTWQASNGSDYYTVTMVTDTGLSETHTSVSAEKNFTGLTCGHNFTVSVTASNGQCNTTASQTASMQTVPCVPTGVSAAMDCANNTALVSWSSSRGASQYSVMATGSHGNASCQSSGLSCRLGNLTCGSNYTVQVSAVDDSCSSVPSQAVLVNSGPCPPHNVSAQVSCSSNDLTISWDVTRNADHFLVSAVADAGGISESCNATGGTQCSIANVACGKTFSVQVTSVRGNCSSQPSPTQTVKSAPCQPQGINATLDCVTNSAWISWTAAGGADSYMVSAAGGNNHMANCTASANTTCEVEDLECGASYNFSVTAKNGQCESPVSATVQLMTAPCSLSAITAVAQCHNSSILVTWDLMQGDAGNTLYNVTAEASDHTYLTCARTGTNCTLQGAQCGLRYTVIVAASSDQCSSMRSPPFKISMEPCPPSNVTVVRSCEDDSALVSWSRSPVAESYTVTAVGADGHLHTCNATASASASNCSLTGLHCGEQYAVSVTARHENCTSSASPNTTLQTGPCPPQGVSVAYHCANQSAVLSWAPSANGVQYYGCAQSSAGAMLYCDSTGTSCTTPGLDCGTVYNFTVRASDGTCNSSFSVPVQQGAVPCPPENFTVQEMPPQMDRQWLAFRWTQASCGDVEFLLELKGDLLGDNQTQFDLSSYWNNSTYFESPLPCGSSYRATVKSRNGGGTGEASATLVGTTAPCAPTGVQYSGNATFATITWQASVFANVYTVYENTTTPWTQMCKVVGLSCSLANITSSSLVVTASNAAGESEGEHIADVVPHSRRRRHLLQVESEDLSPPVLTAQVQGSIVLLDWTAVEDAYFYEIESTKQDGSSVREQYVVYEETSMMLTDLTAGSGYCFTVSANDTGLASEPVCVQT